MRKAIFAMTVMLATIDLAQPQCLPSIVKAFPKPDQQKEICDLWLNSLQVTMVTLQPAPTENHVGNIYALLVNGGALVPFILPDGSAQKPDPVLTIGTCRLTLQRGSKQDYNVRNSCNKPVKAVALYSRNEVVPAN